MRENVLEALLEATAGLVDGNPEDMLAHCCDALVNACSHIRFAWYYLGDPHATIVRAQYAAGPAAEWARSVVLDGTPGSIEVPARRALRSGEPSIMHIDAPEFWRWRDGAKAAGVRLIVSIGFRPAGVRETGLLALGIDNEQFLGSIDLPPLLAFARLAEATLAQATTRRQLDIAARFDPLTALLNRHSFEELVDREHERSVRYGHPYSILLFDVDHLKLVNDQYGRQVGDEVLIGIGTLVSRKLHETDAVARWGGEEFICLLPETDMHRSALVAERLRTAVQAEVIQTQVPPGAVSISTGVASFPGYSSGEALIAAADAHLVQAKRGGRNRVVSRGGDKDSDLHIVGRVRAALANGRIRPAFQPIVDLTTGDVVAEEALARMISVDGQTEYAAASFIDAVTRFDLAHEIDASIIRETLLRCTAQVLSGVSRLHFVNISAGFLRHPELVEEIFAIAQRQCLACGRDPIGPKPLVIEITEREFVQDTAMALAVLKPLLDFGLRIAIDDFGSGYSSFRYLVDLPVSFIKLEGDLVRKIATDHKARAVVQRMQQLGQDLGLVTVAEYVEDDTCRKMLMDMGVDWGQGYLFGRPTIDRSDCADSRL